jgi:hypothetical protein
VSTEEVREWVLRRCDQELESVPYKVIDALRGEYLTFLWRTLNEPFWKEFDQTIILKRDLIDGLQQACEDTIAQLKLDTRAVYTVEEVLTIREHVLDKLIGHLLGLRAEYRLAFPLVVALKACRQDEDKRTRIDYLDETGLWGFIRKDISFQPRSDFYLLRRAERSPIVLPVEDRHQDFIIREDRPLKSRLDDVDLRTLFGKFERCQKALEKSGPQQVGFVIPTRIISPLAKLGISQDGEIFDEALLAQAIKRALQEGETDMIEFKAGPSDDELIAKELAALANTKGGILVFGLPDDPTVGSPQWDQAVTGREKLLKREFRRDFFTRIGKIAKGAPGQVNYCDPPVTCIPHPRTADQYLSGAKGDVIIAVILPIPERGQLCEITGSGVWVRLRGSCERAKPEWLKIYQDSGRKQWMQ